MLTCTKPCLGTGSTTWRSDNRTPQSVARLPPNHRWIIPFLKVDIDQSISEPRCFRGRNLSVAGWHAAVNARPGRRRRAFVIRGHLVNMECWLRRAGGTN